jgi:hypothetical protein
MAAPVAAPSGPAKAPKAAPVAAPMPVARTALFTPLEAEAWPGVPPACSWANCLHVWSSSRNSSKLLPLPGNANMLGPVGMLTQAASGNIAIKGNNLNGF